MKNIIILILLIVTSLASYAADITLKTITASNKMHEGFVAHIYDNNSDKLYLKITNLNSEFIYQSSLPQGLGSNDIGLDRGQLGDTRLVEFQKVGNKIILLQKNTTYRAISKNPKESKSVDEAFASAILWSFPVVDSGNDWVLVDASDFILQDIHRVSRKLKQKKQGDFKTDKSRSVIFLPRTKSFPDNTELEASITFVSQNPGSYVKQAATNPYNITVRMHHSFIRLPKVGFMPRNFHPKSGFWSFTYQDYAQPINKPVIQRFIGRHRLQKKDPNASISEAVEPIIYYLDNGAPEPVKTALITGALWWDQAFESIGYKDAFQVKILPDDVDPMDVRYNVIQWVHRATRGWSYGYGVIDPRNGEIIKGHVTLGSLRVRQDYLIAQGMLSRFDTAEDDHELMDLALARIRQLSAHEVGHTLGLTHNFAASSYNRASVMDYPHPLFDIENNKISAHNAYAENIGLWDKAVIAYGYQDFPDNTDKNLSEILENNKNKKMLFISDQDARKISDAQPKASLWDNGEDAVDELERVIQLRKLALDNFGEASLHVARPYSDLQEILVPVYYFHRYQATAAAKLIGGINYDYSMKHPVKTIKPITPVDAKSQARALDVILSTLSPEFLSLDSKIKQLRYPKAMGYQTSRETPKGNMGAGFDEIALASASAQHSLSLLLNPIRLARLQQQKAIDSHQFGISGIAEMLQQKIIDNTYKNINALIHRSTIDLIHSNYINLIQDARVSSLVKTKVYGIILNQIKFLKKKIKKVKSSSDYSDFYKYQLKLLEAASPDNKKIADLIKMPVMPPGSPI